MLVKGATDGKWLIDSKAELNHFPKDFLHTIKIQWKLFLLNFNFVQKSLGKYSLIHVTEYVTSFLIGQDLVRKVSEKRKWEKRLHM